MPNFFASPCWLYEGLSVFSKNHVGLLIVEDAVLKYVDSNDNVIFSLTKDQITRLEIKNGLMKITHKVSGKTKTFRAMLYDVYGTGFTPPPSYKEDFDGKSARGLSVMPTTGAIPVLTGSLAVANSLAAAKMYQEGKKADAVSSMWAEVLEKSGMPVAIGPNFTNSFWQMLGIFVLGMAAMVGLWVAIYSVAPSTNIIVYIVIGAGAVFGILWTILKKYA